MKFFIKKRHNVLPGFGLTLGYTIFYLCLIVLIPLSALVFKTATLTFGDFIAAVTAPRVVASYRVTFGAALLAAPGMLLGSGLVLQGVARGSITTIAVLLLVETPGVGSRNAGAASGMFFSAAEIGGVTGPLTIGALYDATGGFNAALAALTAITIGLMLGVLALRRNEQRERATVFSVVPSGGAD